MKSNEELSRLKFYLYRQSLMSFLKLRSRTDVQTLEVMLSQSHIQRPAGIQSGGINNQVIYLYVNIENKSCQLNVRPILVNAKSQEHLDGIS